MQIHLFTYLENTCRQKVKSLVMPLVAQELIIVLHMSHETTN